MNALLSILIAITVQSLIATAAPVGICLHAYSPEAPAEKIECFEFEKVERAGADYRFFPRADKSVMVTAYRFRGTILYKPDLAPTHPEFDKLLKLYEETARATPSTRPYLNPRILVMRSQAAAVEKQTENVAKLPTITMADGTQLIGCTMSKIENGFVSIRHQDGISKVSLKELDATEKKALNSTAEGWSLDEPSATSIDSTGTFAKIIFKNGLLLKKAKFKEVVDGDLVFAADGKSVSIPADQFPGELSALGEEVVKSLAPVNKEASPEPSVASSGIGDTPTTPAQAKRSDVASGGGFELPGDDASNEQGTVGGNSSPNGALSSSRKSNLNTTKKVNVKDQKTLDDIEDLIKNFDYYKFELNDEQKGEMMAEFLTLIKDLSEDIQKFRRLESSGEDFLRKTYLSIKEYETSDSKDSKVLYAQSKKTLVASMLVKYTYTLDPGPYSEFNKKQFAVAMPLGLYAECLSNTTYLLARIAAWREGSQKFPLKSESTSELDDKLASYFGQIHGAKIMLKEGLKNSNVNLEK